MSTQQKAKEYLEWFETKKRDNGEAFICTKDGRPSELTELIHAAHGDFMPDNYRYEMIQESLYILANLDDSDDGQIMERLDSCIPVYNGELTAWLASNCYRIEYVNEAVAEYDDSNDIINNIMRGYYKESEEVFYSVKESIEAVQ